MVLAELPLLGGDGVHLNDGIGFGNWRDILKVFVTSTTADRNVVCISSSFLLYSTIFTLI